MRNKRFSIQINEVVDCSGIGHLVAYMQYVADKTINKGQFLHTYKKKSNSKKNPTELLMISWKKKDQDGQILLEYPSTAASAAGLQSLIK
jgi:hypothetical protein